MHYDSRDAWLDQPDRRLGVFTSPRALGRYKLSACEFKRAQYAVYVGNHVV